jgi:hypothetical protein
MSVTFRGWIRRSTTAQTGLGLANDKLRRAVFHSQPIPSESSEILSVVR